MKLTRECYKCKNLDICMTYGGSCFQNRVINSIIKLRDRKKKKRDK